MARRNKRRHESGVALILALLFVALLAAIIVEFIYEMQVEASFASNAGGDLEAYLAAKSAVAKALDLLATDALGDLTESGSTRSGTSSTQKGSRSSSAKPSDNSLGGSLSTGKSSQEFAGSAPWVDSFMDTTPWYEGVAFEPLNNAIMRASISDEYGKLNLNALMDYNQTPPVEREQLSASLREFFAIRLSMAQTASADTARADMIVDSILDWLDYGDEEETRPEGAENDYYMSLQNPFPCKNGPFDSIDELLLLKGMTPQVYYGNAENGQLPLSEYLTVHGDWRGRVNPNTAPIEVLEAVLSGWGGQSGDPGVAQEIYDRAQEQPFQDPGELSQYVGSAGQRNNTGNPSSQAGAKPGASGSGTGSGGSFSTKPKSRDVRKELQNVEVGSGLRIRSSAGTREGEAEGENSLNGGIVPQQGSTQQPFTVCSNVFRIYGDGKMDDIMVRIVAYVWRTPIDPTAVEMTMSGLGGTGIAGGAVTSGTSETTTGTKTPTTKSGIEKQLVSRGQRGAGTTGALNTGVSNGMAADVPSDGTGVMPELPAERFRILDWNVIR